MPDDVTGTGTVTPGGDQASGAVDAGSDDTTTQQGGAPTPGEPEAAGQEDEAVDTLVGEGEGEGEDEDALLSPEEFEALKDNPLALKKALNRSYTQKMQQLSAARTLMEALQSDPRGTVIEMARRAGLVAGNGRQPEPEINQLHAALVEHMGEDAARGILPALEKAFDDMLERKVAPLRQGSERALAVAAVNQSKASLEAFGAKHPDWKQYERVMVDLGQRFQTVPGAMSENEYLETLYTLAKARNPAGMARQLADRMTKSAANAERQPGGFPHRISTEPPADATTKDAVRAAFQGIDWSKGRKG